MGIIYGTFFASLYTNILRKPQRPNDFHTKHAILLAVQYKIVKINLCIKQYYVLTALCIKQY